MIVYTKLKKGTTPAWSVLTVRGLALAYCTITVPRIALP